MTIRAPSLCPVCGHVDKGVVGPVEIHRTLRVKVARKKPKAYRAEDYCPGSGQLPMDRLSDVKDWTVQPPS